MHLCLLGLIGKQSRKKSKHIMVVVSDGRSERCTLVGVSRCGGRLTLIAIGDGVVIAVKPGV